MIKQIKIKTFKRKYNRVQYFSNVSYILFMTLKEELIKINDTTDDSFKKTIIRLGVNSKIGRECMEYFDFLLEDEATEKENKNFFENFQMILDDDEDFALELEESEKYETRWGGGTIYTLSSLRVSKEMNIKLQELNEYLIKEENKWK